MRRLGLVVLLLCGCAPIAGSDMKGSRHAIIGGEPTGSTDPEVFGLYDRTGEFFCSATLIHPRVLLTAAHCVQNGVEKIGNAPNGPADPSLRVLRTWFDPRYSSTLEPDYDVGLVLFSPAVTLTPRPFEHGALRLEVGDAVRAVGFGVQAAYMPGRPDPPYGERRTVDLTVNGVGPGVIHIGERGRAVCYGDSGGPLFATDDGGVERVVGVHSYTDDPSCSGGGSMRIDPHAAAIDAWLAAFGTATCEPDGECVAGCPQLDLDCACAADGRCTAACTRPSLDPDCPPLCEQGDACAVGPCPIPDLDCHAMGAPCDSYDQCAGRQCVNDRQNPGLYCSKYCARQADCDPFGMDCLDSSCRLHQLPEARSGEPCSPAVRCEPGTTCHATLGICTRPCGSPSQCPANFVCKQGGCVFVPPTVQVKTVPTTLGAAGERCSIGGEGTLVLLAALVVQRRRRAKSSSASADSALMPVEQPPRTG